MSKQTINIGIEPDDGTGDPLRTSMDKINSNFTEFYDAIVPLGKNVGIGTPTPSARLNVVSDLSYDAVRITQTGTGNSLVVEDSENPDVTSFIVNKDGYVGIGKNSPTFPLDVNGDMNTSGKLYFDGGTKYIGFQDGSYVLPAADLNIKGYKAITVNNFNTYAPTLTGAGASGAWGISVDDSTYSTGSRANTFTIGTAAYHVANGNLGIGISTPQAKLHVNNHSANAILGVSNTSTAIRGVSNSSSGGEFYSNTGVGLKVFSNTGIVAEFSNNSQTVFTIDNKGLLRSPQQTKTSTSTGVAGNISWDANYIYICTATNTWKRVALTGGVF